MDPGKIFQIITNSTLLATRLLSDSGKPMLEFSQNRYCVVLREDAPVSSRVIAVEAKHKEGANVVYSISGGNAEGLFSIDDQTGVITVAASLDYELEDKHEIEISSEGGGQIKHAVVQVSVADVNDNAPFFVVNPDPHVTVIEEDDRHLPTSLIKVEAEDPDLSDRDNLYYSLRGDGVDGHRPEDAYFSINSRTGDVIQLKALDRDPPNGKRVWKLKVKVQDGQKRSKEQIQRSIEPNLSWNYEEGYQADQWVFSNKESSRDSSHKKSTVNTLESPNLRSGYITTKDQVSSDKKEHMQTEFRSADSIDQEKDVKYYARPKRKASDRVRHNINSETAADGGSKRHKRTAHLRDMDHDQSVNWKDKVYLHNRKLNKDVVETNEFVERESIQREGLLTIRTLPGDQEESNVHPDRLSETNHEKNVSQLRTDNVKQDRIFSDVSLIRNSNQRQQRTDMAQEMSKGGNKEIQMGKLVSAKTPFTTDDHSDNNAISDSYNLWNRNRTSESVQGYNIFRDRIKPNEDDLRKYPLGHDLPNDCLRDKPCQESTNFDAFEPEFPEKSLYLKPLLEYYNAGFHSKGQPLQTGVKSTSKRKENNLLESTNKEKKAIQVEFYASTVKNFSPRSFEVLPVSVSLSQPDVGITKPPVTRLFVKRSSHRRRVSQRKSKFTESQVRETNSRYFRKFSFTEPKTLKSNEPWNFDESKDQIFLRSPTPFFNLSGQKHVKGNGQNDVFLQKATKEKRKSSDISISKSDIVIDHELSSTSIKELANKPSSNQMINFQEASARRIDSSHLHGFHPEFFYPSHNKRLVRDISKREMVIQAQDHSCPTTEVIYGTSNSNYVVDGVTLHMVHAVEVTVTVLVKDINDNAPAFPNVTMFGEIQENGPAALSVIQVSAWDTDDATEGSNARITYFIEKNVIHDKTGEAIFSVHPQTGLVTTAICCLDRETTPEYHIQVVAMDGGGLKGTGTVIVQLTDENDNSPRLPRKIWDLEVDETWGGRDPDNITLLEMTAADPDARNDFSYRVVENSGSGWDLFGIRSTGVSGQLFALRPLDYENEEHRRGLKFMVQVTDRGQEGWSDPRHQDSAWIGVKIRNLNDNAPVFTNPNAHITVKEDMAPGTILLNMTAHDPDVSGGGSVKYRIIGDWDALGVDNGGGIRLQRHLDRESESEEMPKVKILAMDGGNPPMTSTATLSISVRDINDCPPRLLPPTVFHVQEGAPSVRLGVLKATDNDVWALGHGPPFTFALAKSNPSYVLSLIDLKFDRRIDSGRGGAEVWTKGSLDREKHRQIDVDILIADAQQLNSTSVITVIVGDVNDNPMKPASKTVYLWKTRSSGSDAPLGRVYVEDPDDWDLVDKSFGWAGKRHPLFTLNDSDGTIFASSQVREGRYALQFHVIDHLWQQDVLANVTVVVRDISRNALAHAAPITLTPTTPTALTRGWTPSAGGGMIGKLISGIQEIPGWETHKVEVLSVYGNDFVPLTPPNSFPSSIKQSKTPKKLESHSNNILHDAVKPIPYTCVWVGVTDSKGNFVDPVKLQGLLALHSTKLEEVTGLTITFNDPASDLGSRTKGGGVSLPKDSGGQPNSPLDEGSQLFPSGEREDPEMSTLTHANEEASNSAAFLPSTVLPLQVVDTNVTSLVTPLLFRSHKCPTESSFTDGLFLRDVGGCSSSSCLNGGRCVRFPNRSRCICPGGSSGPHCKVISRSFAGSGWAWLEPIPSCLPATISFQLLTKDSNALLLYAGPLARPSDSPLSPAMSMVTVQVVDESPQLLVEVMGESIKLQVNRSVSDGNWHAIHVLLDNRGASLMVDLCGVGWDSQTSDDSHCVARESWTKAKEAWSWESFGSLQVGGIALSSSRLQDYGWKETPIRNALTGCLSHLVINGQVRDLGRPPYSQETSAGCHLQESACVDAFGSCGVSGICVGGLNTPECQCEPGKSGPDCRTPTVPTTLGSRSYMKIALSFTPPSEVLVIQVRVRSIGIRTGVLVHLAAQRSQNSFSLHLRAGVACASVSGAGWTTRSACVKGYPVSDGQWHTIRAERHGHSLLVAVDDGDIGLHNYSVPSLSTYFHEGLKEVAKPPMPLEIDKHDGVAVGGIPEFMGVALISVKEDLQDTCIDDLRVSGRRLPLPPVINGSSWGQVTSLGGITHGCSAPGACLNNTCEHPLSCNPTWMQASCSCGPGRHLVSHTCEDINECLLEPCLHGGSCLNLNSGYECLCGPNHLGDNCEWTKATSHGHPLSAPVIAAALTFSLLVLVVLGVFISLRSHRLRASRRELSRQKRSGEEGEEDESVDLEFMTPSRSDEKIIRAVESKKLGSGEVRKGEELHSKGTGDEPHVTFLELLKVSRNQMRRDSQGKEGGTGDGIISAAVSSSGDKRSHIGPTPGTATNTEEHQRYRPHQELHNHQLPGEDLRNYAYEGDGSSSGSLSSTISGLRAEFERDENSVAKLPKEFLEVVDLLKNLPDAPKSSALGSIGKQGRDLKGT